jgi:hypothetical protein
MYSTYVHKCISEKYSFNLYFFIILLLICFFNHSP